MPGFRRLAWYASLLALAAFGSDGHCHAAEPQATFSLEKGWVEVALRQDGGPVANATIQIMDENGGKHGSGETGEDGQAIFLLPAGASFVVEIKTGDRTADPIRLFKSEAGLEPARVLLSYGLRPCCRSIKPRADVMIVGAQAEMPAAPSAEPMPREWLLPVLAGMAIALAIFFVAWRRTGIARGLASRE